MRRLRRVATALLLALPAAGDEAPAFGGGPVAGVVDVEGIAAERLPGLGVEAGAAAGRPPGRAPLPERARGPEGARGAFAYHKSFWPPDRRDAVALVLSALGLVVAGGGGIGGGGILVPLFMLATKFRPKHAIALSNFTILGGSIASTFFNVRGAGEMGSSMIDWDIVAMMEPSTIAGAVLGSFLSKLLPDFVLSAFLVVVLALLSYRTLDKGIRMFQRESEDEHKRLESVPEEDYRSDDEDNEAEQLIGGEGAAPGGGAAPWLKIKMLLVCLGGCVLLTALRGPRGPGALGALGAECGSAAFWLLALAPLPWAAAFGAYFRRRLLLRELARGPEGAARWDARTTLRYPLVCSLAGVLAGLFGLGGGIVKGPLMLEMGVEPLTAAATAATMILFTSTAACASFQVFGLLEPGYGAACFALGLVCTAAGRGATGAWARASGRQSPPVLSIGLVMALSTALVALEASEQFATLDWGALLRPAELCAPAA